MVPTAGCTDQVTAVFELPVTVAENCWFCEAVRDIVERFSETARGGLSITVAIADFVGSAMLVAITEMF